MCYNTSNLRAAEYLVEIGPTLKKSKQVSVGIEV